MLQTVHTHHGPHGYTSLVKITFHLSLSSAEPELLLSHDHSHAWRGSRGQPCSRIGLVYEIQKKLASDSLLATGSLFLVLPSLFWSSISVSTYALEQNVFLDTQKNADHDRQSQHSDLPD